ncbi:MAG TPA: sulfatase [Oceanipulchritudo sp.]|nr:sulfatase [Oceanipulchritudo sp.]
MKIPLLLFLLIGSCQLFADGLKPAEASRPNVLFIMTDDLNCNLGCYGHPLVKTPNIDKLASQGLQFNGAFCNYPLCGPSRASFMTGLYPHQNGVTRLRRLFRNYVPDAVTLAQHFMTSGYSVARVGKIYHYDNPNGIGTNGHDDAASWQVRINPRGVDKDLEDQIFSLRKGSFGGTLSWLAADAPGEEHTDGLVATESLRLMNKYAASGQPFFLAVGFYKPHTPYVAPKEYFDMYDLSEIVVPKIPPGYWDTLPPLARASMAHYKDQLNLSDDLARQAIRAYYATISFADAQVGRVLDGLEALGLKDNTIVLFSSDHGYHMGEHGHYQKRTLFEDSDRVPLIISAPGMKAVGQSTESLVEMIDFYRTLSALTGLPEPPDYVMGKNLGPLLDDPSIKVRDSAVTELETGFTVRTARYRFTRWIDGEMELYDRSVDPAEMVNLAGKADSAPLIASLIPVLEERIAEATATRDGLSFTAPKKDDNGISMENLLKQEAQAFTEHQLEE